jgi:transposase
MAIAIRTGEQAFQVQMVCLDELVAETDVLRRVERLVSWTSVRETARPFYSDFGRPGVDPVVLVKVFLVAAIRGIDSMRETLRVAEVDLAVRRFLGYGLTERLPHHATFSYAQCVRFASSSVFEQLFNQVLASCRDAGLLDGSRLIVDGTHVEANAALKSLRAAGRVRGSAPTVGAGRATQRPDPETQGVQRHGCVEVGS